MRPAYCFEKRPGGLRDNATMMVYCNARLDIRRILARAGVQSLQYVWSSNSYYQNPTHHSRRYKYWCQLVLTEKQYHQVQDLDYADDVLNFYCWTVGMQWLRYVFSK